MEGKGREEGKEYEKGEGQEVSERLAEYRERVRE